MSSVGDGLMYLPVFENFNEAGKYAWGAAARPSYTAGCWYPYANINRTVTPEYILNQLILGRSKTMLICFHKATRHLPDHCLRRFCMHQTIAQEIQRWKRKNRGVDNVVDLSAKIESELSE
ncbi:hypothetical protein RD792_008146 [Penstemon davidsonii]|uniref:Aminotransferase-like plant mobile domain-containing protein n=1 Tax=Penstemon davidsonii TaxID=160366 RepID=A0ABR0D920_9LAMI|nr:hypothetical protein RD792_008146 [Penstemon davidsonii]